MVGIKLLTKYRFLSNHHHADSRIAEPTLSFDLNKPVEPYELAVENIHGQDTKLTG